MSTQHSTARTRSSKTPDQSDNPSADNHVDNPPKPRKPYPEYPLTPHPTGRWCKKIRGRLHYFGPISDPDAALAKYLDQKDALHAGRKPRAESDGATVKDVANAFLNAKQALVDAGELSALTWADYKLIAGELLKEVGKGRLVVDLDASDFACLRKRMAKRWGPHRILKLVQYVRSMFKHAWETGLIATPVRFGPDFKRPSKKTLRQNRAKRGAQLFSSEEIHRLLNAASPPLKAMILLGINCGFGNADCGQLPLSAVDLETGVIDFPRPKTGVARRCPLWHETVAAIKEALAERPPPKREPDAGLVFLTKYGLPWARGNDPAIVTKEIAKLLHSLGINGSRNFYTLRHTFRTVADETRDQPAVDLIMGHEIPHMSTVYRERIGEERLRAVAEHVRGWLFGAQADAAKPDVIPFANQA
jgi:integrase